MASHAARPCCGHSAEASYDGYCTLLTCTCFCRSLCAHRKVTVPGEARLAERTRGSPLWGFCRDCRAQEVEHRRAERRMANQVVDVQPIGGEAPDRPGSG